MFSELAILRQAGFFQEYASLTDEQLLDVLRQKRRQEYAKHVDKPFEPTDFSHIKDVLEYDVTKYFRTDLEADVAVGNNVYVNLTENFATLSNGAFRPTAIQEIWHSPNGPIEVSFLSDGTRMQFEPEYDDDWLDDTVFEFFKQRLAKDSPYQFWQCQEWPDQTVIFMRLTEPQKQLLERKLNWRFA